MNAMRVLTFFVLILATQLVNAATQTLFLNDTTERVVVTHDPALNPASAITIEAWVRPSSTGCQTIVGKNFATGYWFGICGGQSLRYYVRGGISVDGARAVPTNQWSHLAVTYNGTTVRFYVNGELDATRTASGTLPSNNAPLGIGGEGAAAGFPSGLFPFPGYMSEVRLWRTVRSQAEIRQAMYQQITEEDSNLIGVWSLEGGEDDRFGRFSSILAPGASFSGLDSPPVPFDPIRIRPATSITADGRCTDAGYSSSTRMPSWYPSSDLAFGEINPQEILVGASGTYLYVCFPERSQLSSAIWSVEIDPDNDGGFSLATDDWRFRLWASEDGLKSFRGSVGPPPFFISSWVETPNPAGLIGLEEPGVEFVTDMEFRIPRSIFPDSTARFRIRTAHNYLNIGGATDTTVDWPFDGSTFAPDSWAEAIVDLSPVGPPDYQLPRVTASIEDDRPAFFENAEITVEASDDSDIELVELLVDDVVVESRDYTGTSDRSVSFTHSARYAPGRHLYYARAFDQAGRERVSLIGSFRVLVDGEPPRIALSIDPRRPAIGQTVTVTARARDASGVSTIQLRDVLGFLSPSFQRCDFSPAGGVETCSWTITPPARVTRLRLDALATDSEGFVADSPDQVVLFGNSGTDSDGDGLADTVEAGLCTDPTNPDTDGDGLSDGWEVEGILFDDGSAEPLVDYGVNPCWKNALLQLDWETGAQPPTDGITNLRNRYRDNGIAIYLETNERPRPTAYPQSHIGAGTAVYQVDDGDRYFDPKRNWAFYYGYERNLPGRSGAWERFFTVDHNIGSSGYCSGGDEPGKGCRGDFECPGAGAQCVAGCNGGDREGLTCSSNTQCPMDDGSFAVCTAPCTTDGSGGTACGTIGDLPYRLFHEFGHTVGLGHGGRTGTRVATATNGLVSVDNAWDSRNYKPNHQSAMNYMYNQGELCIEPIPASPADDFRPRLIGQLTYMTRDLGDLNENSLRESPTDTFSVRLRQRDCSFASATAIPVVKYTCKFDDVQYEVLSDGIKTLARRPRDGSWDYTPPTHAAGIDWNCNGTIDGGTVAENVNGPGWFRSDGFWDESAWNRENELRGRSEFDAIPNPVGCQVLYSANCAEREKSCYLWPASYRSAIGTLLGGVDPIDCRARFLANRGGDCGGGSDAEFGTGTCPTVSPDTPVLAAINEKQVGGFDAMAAGPPGFDSDQFIQLTESEETPASLSVELCDGSDNNSDGQIDEGCADSDTDGVPDDIDNCPAIANADQADRDGDGLGEACQFPQISNLQAAWDGQRTVTLTWTGDDASAIGYTVYRYGVEDPNPQYRGDPYPTAIEPEFDDAVSLGDTYTYVVRAVNQNGIEGEPISVTVQVQIANELFSDSFEQ